MPELFHGLDVENLDIDAKPAQSTGAAGKFHGVEHVRGLIHQFARHQDAIDDMGIGCERLARSADIADRHRHVDPQGGFLAVLFPGLVAVEFVGAQPHPRGDRGGLPGLHGSGRQFGNNGRRFAAGIEFAGDRAAEFEEVLFLEFGMLAGSDHDQALNLDSIRRQNIKRRPAFALELVGCRRASYHRRRRAQRLAGRGAEFQRVVAKYHQHAARNGGKRNEADLDGVGHEQILQKSGL